MTEVTLEDIAVSGDENQFLVLLKGPEGDLLPIVIDAMQALAIAAGRAGEGPGRPLTHDLIQHIFTGLEVSLDHIIINDVQDGTFFARIFLTMKNELGTKILELDARPSDSIVLALQSGKPIYVLRKVLDEVEDMTELLERILKEEN